MEILNLVSVNIDEELAAKHYAEPEECDIFSFQDSKNLKTQSKSPSGNMTKVNQNLTVTPIRTRQEYYQSIAYITELQSLIAAEEERIQDFFENSPKK